MSVAQTSIFAYKSVKKKLNAKQSIVYETLQEVGRATNEQLSDILHWPINTVTPRVNELKKMGMVGVEGLAMSKAGRPSKLWSVRDMNDKKLIEVANECAE